jgi:hypothetical protein
MRGKVTDEAPRNPDRTVKPVLPHRLSHAFEHVLVYVDLGVVKKRSYLLVGDSRVANKPAKLAHREAPDGACAAPPVGYF